MTSEERFLTARPESDLDPAIGVGTALVWSVVGWALVAVAAVAVWS